MGKVLRFRRGVGFWCSALLKRLVLAALLLSGLDFVHDGRVGWPGTVAPRLATSQAEAAMSARGWLQGSPAFCSACGANAVPDGDDAASRRIAAIGSPESAASKTRQTDEPTQSVDADFAGRVDRVIDGDSLRVRIATLGLIEVRLHGIDTPEYDQPYGSAAKRELRRLVANRRVALVRETVDSYGRLVGTVYRDGMNVNLEMVRRGYAWWYRRYAGFDFALRRAEKEAREQRRGLWRDADPVPPWEWRRR